MVKSTDKLGNQGEKSLIYLSEKRPGQYARLASMGKISANIIDELYNPIEAINRFINLALHHIDEDDQSRQFLLESKSGVRKMAVLLNRLNKYAKKIERELKEVAVNDGSIQ